MNTTWQIQEAKNRLSELLEHAMHNGPQTITRHGKRTAVVLSYEQYKKLIKPKTNLVEFFRSSPLCGIGINASRQKDFPRKIEL